MNKDDLFDVSFNGIPSECLSGVSKEAQEAVVKAFPDLRLLWNPRINRYQIAIREDGSRAGWIDGQKLVGWFLMGRDFPPTVSRDEIVAELRRVQEFNESQIKAMGYENAGDYVDAAWEKAKAELEAEKDALADDVFGTAAKQRVYAIDGIAPNEQFVARTRERENDIASGKRHVRRGKVRFAGNSGLVLDLNRLRG